MKKFSIYILILTWAFASCKKDNNDTLFGERADQRLNEAITKYGEQLAGAQYGWKAFLSTTQGESFGFYFQFNNSNRVKMYSDFDGEFAVSSFESSYRLKAVQRPSLFFDTYSYLHVLADPDEGISGGDRGAGRYSDFEFSFDTVKTDSIKMTGTFMGSKLLLVRATKAEYDAYQAGALNVMIQSAENYASETPFSFVQIKDSKYETIISPEGRVLALAYQENNEDKFVKTSFAYAVNGLHLEKPVTLNGVTFDELLWDASGKHYYIQAGTQRITVQASSSPTAPLSILLGMVYTSVVVPNGSGTNPLPGTSALFLKEYNASKAAILAGPYRLTLKDMEFAFDASDKSMVINAVVAQGATNFLATFTYSYKKTADGLFKFTPVSQNGNGGLIKNDMTLLKYIESDSFKVDYLKTDTGLLGKLSSTHVYPGGEFSFTGLLQ
ncbi:DUF4302 domain-containing protein [Arcticibacter sp. MXS-1]|uniref:DUF4302 domain-containing protein n=1 Tax=Arcticibacter sp. MXS-1 TaxID=3341726 RepID=UPI0035A870B5